MAIASLILPGAVVKLAEAVSVDLSSVAVQNLLQAPVGAKVIVTELIVRDASGTAAATTATVGPATTLAGTPAAGIAVTTLAGLTAGQYARFSAPATPVAELLPNQYLNLLCAGTASSAGTLCKVEVIGYIEVL